MWDASTIISATALVVSIVGYIVLTSAFVVRTRSMTEMLSQRLESNQRQSDERLESIQAQWLREIESIRREFGEHMTMIRNDIHTLGVRSNEYHALSAKIGVLEERVRRLDTIGERKP